MLESSVRGVIVCVVMIYSLCQFLNLSLCTSVS